ncbi:MAG: hypothetical protein J5801_03155 [Bacteroidales bacterium]|nr:hypothetical protein [Bacteroidales bacterium]
MNDIEQFLKENKPLEPAEGNFMIEVNSRLEAVEAVKRAVSAERSRSRALLLAALASGLLLGCIITAIIMLHPVAPGSLGTQFIVRLSMFLQGWARYIIMLLIAGGAIALGLAFASPRRERQV